MSWQHNQTTSANKILSSSFWIYFGTAVSTGAYLVTSIIVSRFLTPTDFAIAGLALSIYGIFSQFTQQGFNKALIQRQQITSLSCHSVFWLLTCCGGALWIIVLLSAPYIARLYKQPALILLMSFLGAMLLYNLAAMVPLTLLQRETQFRKLSIIKIVTGILSSLLTIQLAWQGYGYLALIIGAFVAAALNMLFAFYLADYFPKLAFSWSEIRAMSGFGLTIWATNLLSYLSDNLDYLAMGYFWKQEQFGQYYFAFERSRQPFNLLYGQLSFIMFPIFSRLQSDHNSIKQIVLKSTQIFCVFSLPLYTILIILADPIVPLIFGQQWQPSVPLFQIFSAFAIVRSLAVLVPSCMLAIGRPQIGFFFNLFRIVVICPTIFFLALQGAGPVKVSFILVIIWYLQIPFFIIFIYRNINLTLQEFWQSLRRIFGAAFAMSLTLIGTQSIFRQLDCDWFAWVEIAMQIVIGLAIFAFFTKKILVQIISKIYSLLSTRAGN